MLKGMIKPLIFGLVGFFGGYQIAVITQSPTLTPAEERSVKVVPSNEFNINKWRKDKTLSPSQHQRNIEQTADIEKNDFIDELSESLERDDLDSMLDRLEDLRAEGNNGQLVAIQHDLLKQFLIDNPENIDNILGQLSGHSVDSGSFNTLLSLIKTLPSEQTEFAVTSFAEQYAGSFDRDSKDKLLAVLSATSNPIKSEYIINSLVDMATFEDTDIDTKLEALSLVKSHQLHESQKNDLSTEISQLLDNSDGHDAARLVPHLMRLSKTQRRIEIASKLLSQNNSEPTRSEVLSSINSGLIPKSDEMKAMLFEIAADPDDTLSQEAAETLEYSFELTQQEYKQLTARD